MPSPARVELQLLAFAHSLGPQLQLLLPTEASAAASAALARELGLAERSELEQLEKLAEPALGAADPVAVAALPASSTTSHRQRFAAARPAVHPEELETSRFGSR